MVEGVLSSPQPYKGEDMRELKFRVYDKKERCYSDKPFSIDQLGICYIQDEDGYWEEIDEERFIIEQYAGLKDDNGKEIYEGDIVKARWYRAKNARFNTKGEIKFNDGWFYIKDDPDCHDRLGVPIHNCYNIEVIGNIHELNKEEE